MQQTCIGLVRRTEHEHARVEAVGPTRVRSRRELLAIKQVVDVLKHLHYPPRPHTLASPWQPATPASAVDIHTDLTTLTRQRPAPDDVVYKQVKP